MFRVGTVFEGVIRNQFAALQSLQKSIVQIMRETRPLGYALSKSRTKGAGRLFHSQIVNQPQNKEYGKQARNAERGCLVPGRSDRKGERISFFVPYALVVAGRNKKFVRSRSKVRIRSGATSAAILPFVVVPLKSVTKTDMLRHHKTERRVFNLNVPRKRANARGRSYCHILVVSNQSLDMHRDRV